MYLTWSQTPETVFLVGPILCLNLIERQVRQAKPLERINSGLYNDEDDNDDDDNDDIDDDDESLIF